MHRIAPLSLFRLSLVLLFAGVCLTTFPLALSASELDAQIEQRIEQDLVYLASDELQGRGVFTLGLEKSADFLSEQYKQIGLDTDLYDGTAFQNFQSKTNWVLGSNSYANIQIGNTSSKLTLNQEYTPLKMSASDKFDLPLAFAGYGITSAEDQYDDYANFDAQGKAVILLRHEPLQNKDTGRFNGTKNSSHAFLDSKIENAIKHGAAAVIFVTDNVAITKREANRRNKQPDKDYLLRFDSTTEIKERKIPVFHFKRAIVDAWLKQSNHPALSELEQQIDETYQPVCFDLEKIKITGEVQVDLKKQHLKNVLGLIPGSGPDANETIVVGAHYDHLGMGGGGSLAPWTIDIHNGADDNASGTVAILEIARQLKQRLPEQHRRILFIAFSAEEKGLIGSSYYVNHPLIPLKDTVAMLNLDMVGRLRNDKLTLYGTGTAEEFSELATKAAEVQQIKLSKVPSGYGPSDHASFYAKGIPVFHFFTGFHNDYHRPSDDADKVNISGVRRISLMASEMILELATATKKPTKTTVDSIFGLSEGRIRPSRDRTPQTAGPQLGVTVQEMPENQGLKIIRVSAGSVAEKSQLKPNDILRSVSGKNLNNALELRNVIKPLKQGDNLKAVIRRGSIDLEIDLQF